MMAQVVCRVYDISLGMAKQMSLAVVGKQFDIIPHTGIYVYGACFLFPFADHLHPSRVCSWVLVLQAASSFLEVRSRIKTRSHSE